jgi:hypothetical protein
VNTATHGSRERGAHREGSRIARYVGGPLDGRTEDLVDSLGCDAGALTAEQIDRLTEHPPEWISTELGVYVLRGSSPTDASWEYAIVPLRDVHP